MVWSNIGRIRLARQNDRSTSSPRWAGSGLPAGSRRTSPAASRLGMPCGLDPRVGGQRGVRPGSRFGRPRGLFRKALGLGLLSRELAAGLCPESPCPSAPARTWTVEPAAAGGRDTSRSGGMSGLRPSIPAALRLPPPHAAASLRGAPVAGTLPRQLAADPYPRVRRDLPAPVGVLPRLLPRPASAPGYLGVSQLQLTRTPA